MGPLPQLTPWCQLCEAPRWTSYATPRLLTYRNGSQKYTLNVLQSIIFVLFGFINREILFLQQDLPTHQNLPWTPVSTSGAFMIIYRHVQSSEHFEPADVHILSQGQVRWHTAMLFQLFYLNKCSSCGLLGTFFPFAFVCFCWWFHCLNGPQP